MRVILFLCLSTTLIMILHVLYSKNKNYSAFISSFSISASRVLETQSLGRFALGQVKCGIIDGNI